MSGDKLYGLEGQYTQSLPPPAEEGSLGVREGQRELRFSSPSVSHHLEKLRGVGMVSRDEQGRYGVSEKVDVDALKMFIIVGVRLLSRLLLYAAFFTSLTALYILDHHPLLDPYAATFSTGSTATSRYETIRIWRHGEW